MRAVVVQHVPFEAPDPIGPALAAKDKRVPKRWIGRVIAVAGDR